MTIKLSAIWDSARHFDFDLKPDWWQKDETSQILGLDNPIRCRVDISWAGGRYLFQGSISGGVWVRCDRCLEPYHYDVDSEFKLYLAPPTSNEDQSEIELIDDDMDIEFITGDEVHVEEIIRGQIILAVPMKTLCREDCKGLCLTCGTNLNMERCMCKPREGHPGFSKLKVLKNNIEGENT